jgi:CheY-like chemotaxis protein
MTCYVLIVDDEFGLADVLAGLLLDLGYDVSIVINGKLALDSLAQRRADIVITDLMMPVMDGPELIRRMRADAALAHIPAILLTALPEAIPTVPELAQHDAVLVKPFAFEELLATMQRLLPGA